MVSIFLVICFICLVVASSLDNRAYIAMCDSAFCRIIDDASKEIATLTTSVNDGVTIHDFGQKADQLCNSALERFSAEAPIPDDDKENEAFYDKKVEDLERTLDAPLNVVYLKQLSLLREKALKNFRSALLTEGSEYEAMMQADEYFRREAEEATRQNPDWDYARESMHLKSTMGEVA